MLRCKIAQPEDGGVMGDKPFLISRVTFAKSAFLQKVQYYGLGKSGRARQRRFRHVGFVTWALPADRPAEVIAEETAMARMFPAICPATNGGVAIPSAERLLFARLARELDAGWQVIHDCAVRGGALDFVLLHRDYGIALLTVAAPGAVADPELAVAAFRAALEDIGFAQRYRGHIAIVARSLAPDAVSDLAAFLAARFAAAPLLEIADPTWPDWLLQRLVPARLNAQPAAAPTRGLRAPTPDDSWRSFAADKPKIALSAGRDDDGSSDGGPLSAPPRVRVSAERIPVSRDVQTRSPLWTGMMLSVVVVAAVMVGIAVLSYGNGPRDAARTQSAASPPSAAPIAGAPAAN
jgi:hypothetical protein